MNKRQVIQHAKNYMDLLSQGIDPITQKEVGSVSIIAEPRLQKCFAFVSSILEELLANGGYVALPDDGPDAPPSDDSPQYDLVRRKVAFQLSQEQRRLVYITEKPITPNTFINHVNRVIDSDAMEKLSIRRVNTWLLNNGFISATKQPTVIQRTVMKPMQKAAQIGIEESEVIDPKTGEIKSRIVLTQKAQCYLLNNLDRILEENKQMKPDNASKPWLPEEDAELLYQYKSGISVTEIAKQHKRTKGAIRSRLVRLGVAEHRSRVPEVYDGIDPIDNDEMRDRFLHGEAIPRLAQRYGRTETAIRARLFYMGFGGSGPHVLPDQNDEND